MPERLNFSKSTAVNVSGALAHFPCCGKFSVKGASMSITSDRFMSAIVRAEYSSGECANSRKRPRLTIGAASAAPAAATAPRRSSRRESMFTGKVAKRFEAWETAEGRRKPQKRQLLRHEPRASPQRHRGTENCNCEGFVKGPCGWPVRQSHTQKAPKTARSPNFI